MGLGVKIEDILDCFCFYSACMESFNLNNEHFRIFLSDVFDDRVQCPRLGLEVKIYDTSARGIRVSQGTFSTCFMYTNLAIVDSRFSF